MAQGALGGAMGGGGGRGEERPCTGVRVWGGRDDIKGRDEMVCCMG